MNLGKHPQPTAPWRPLTFRVHCLVTQRWMKIRVPFNWFWFGDNDYGTPEVESGTIAASNPTPPAIAGPRLPPGVPAPLDAGPLPEEELEPYIPLSRRKPPSPDSILPPDLQERLRQLQNQVDQLQRNPGPW